MADNVNVNPSGSTLIATDDVNGVQFQKVKLTIGGNGLDNETISRDNPIPVEDIGLLKLIKNIFGRFSFSTDSSLRISGAVTTSGTVTTMSTGNIGFGDSGKTSTIQQVSANTFYGSVGRNFTR